MGTKDKILIVLLKQFSIDWTISSLASEINLSRVGTWKVLKKLEQDKFVILKSIGQGKTNVMSIKLNWENLVLEKKLSLILAEESLKYQRWLNNFEELRNITYFTLIYGSILHSPKEANDIDILEVISNKKEFIKIEKVIQRVQKTQIKKIHSESFTKEEFRIEIKKPNKIFIDAIKKGVILFEQENFVKFIREVQNG